MDILDLMKNLTVKENDSKEQLFKSVAADIDDIPTEIVVAEYSDKILLIISQFQKIGSMLMIQRDQVQNSPVGVDNNIFTTKVIFGATGEEQQVAARYLAEELNIVKPLCIFINLKSYDIETVKACKDIIFDIKKEDYN